MILPFDYIGYKRLSENKHFPNHRWYSDATWGEMSEGITLQKYNFFDLKVKGQRQNVVMLVHDTPFS
jgi:hypothetical protein